MSTPTTKSLEVATEIVNKAHGRNDGAIDRIGHTAIIVTHDLINLIANALDAAQAPESVPEKIQREALDNIKKTQEMNRRLRDKGICVDPAQSPKVEESDREWPSEKEYRRLARSWKDQSRAEALASASKLPKQEYIGQSPKVEESELDKIAVRMGMTDAEATVFKAGFRAGRDQG